MTARFEPEGTSVEGFGIEELDPSWIGAAILNDAVLPEGASEPGQHVQDYGGTFEVLRDFDEDGRLEKATVVVYRASAGEVGRFLLILEADGSGWSRETLFRQPGQPGFSVLRDNDGQLQWRFCLKCDSMCAVLPSTRQFELDCHRTAVPTRG